MNEEEYQKGWKHWLIRQYFYLLTGSNFVGDFKNIGLAILGLYIALKLTDPTLIALMVIVSIAVLWPVGYFVTHKVNRVKEWLQTKFGSHYAVKNFNFVEEQYNLLVEIRDLLKGQK